MTRRRITRIAVVVGVVAVLQVAAIIIYRHVESSREARTEHAEGSFAVEPVAVNAVLSLERIDKSSWSLESVHGRPVVLHFWATWCGPCRAELPTLIAHQRRLHARGVELVLASVDDDWVAIREFFGDAGIPASVSRVTDDAYKRLTTGTLPETLFVDASGTARERVRGARDWRSSAAISFLENLAH